MRRAIKLKSYGKLLFPFILFFLFFSIFSLNSLANLSESGSFSRFSTSLKLSELKLGIEYSTRTDKIKIEYFSKEDEKKEYEVSLASENKLGLLIMVEGKRVSYSVELLEDEESWDPLEGLEDQDNYVKRAKFSQTEGWEIIVVEKIESVSV